MKKALIISLAFPPIPYVGVFRITKFCKYLPETGWKPSVLTQKAKKFYEGMDWSPLEDIGKDIKIIRTSNFQPLYWWDHRHSANRSSGETSFGKPEGLMPVKTLTFGFFIKNKIKKSFQFLRKLIAVPDERMAWIPQALAPAIRYMNREKIDIIFSSSPSPTNHILGYLLSIFYRSPHVIDFRDLWMEGNILRNLPVSLIKLGMLFEKLILRHSKRIIVVNKTLKRQLLHAYPDISKNKVEVIYNGFDEDDFRKIKLPERKNEFFTILYAGGIYGYRNPDFFFKCLSEWVKSDDRLKSSIRVKFYGANSSAHLAELEKSGLNSIVSFLPRVTRNEILQILFSADLSLLLHGLDKRAESSTSTKLFEYLATGKPILAFMPESEASEILRKYSNSCVVSSPDIEKVIQFLDQAYKSWLCEKEPGSFKWNFPPEFSRKYQAYQLAAVFDSVMDGVKKN